MKVEVRSRARLRGSEFPEGSRIGEQAVQQFAGVETVGADAHPAGNDCAAHVTPSARNRAPKLAFGDFVFGFARVFYKGFKAVRYPIEFLVLAFGKSRECGACGFCTDFEQAVAKQVFDFEIGNF